MNKSKDHDDGREHWIHGKKNPTETIMPRQYYGAWRKQQEDLENGPYEPPEKKKKCHSLHF